MAKTDLTAQRLRELLQYDPETGLFVRIAATSPKSGGGRGKLGGVIGYSLPVGYIIIRVVVQRYYAHRLAWLYMTGAWPDGEIDHINGIKHDNRWTNLRDVDKSTNNQNRSLTGAASNTGLLGVYFDKWTGRYVAQIKTKGKQSHLGRFDTPEEAHAAYAEAKKDLHPGFAR